MGNLMKMRQSERREGRLEGVKIGEQRTLKSAFNSLLANGIARPQAAKLLGLTPKKLQALLSA